MILVQFQVFQHENSVKFCCIMNNDSSGLFGVWKSLTAIDANSSSHFIMSVVIDILLPCRKFCLFLVCSAVQLFG